ncbi:hypothetical protein BH11ACT7_BH11ACT7_39880 [soil metagenome]
MTRIHSRTVTWSVMAGALGVAAVLSASPSASADPTVPALPAPEPVATGMQHLTSPENLPPGATMAPTDPNQGRGVSYLRELWHAVQTQEVSKSGALLLLTQRPMNPDSPAGLPLGPQAPLPATAPIAP